MSSSIQKSESEPSSSMVVACLQFQKGCRGLLPEGSSWAYSSENLIFLDRRDVAEASERSAKGQKESHG